MGRVLMAWELGLNLGHLYPISWLAARFREHGHEVVFCLKQTHGAPGILGSDAWILPAPSPPERPAAKEPKLLNYADLLVHHGYGAPAELERLLLGWRAVLEEAQPDVVVADHAPTALLAARSKGVPAAVYGIGFLVPPREAPLPPFRWWKASPGRARLRRLERTALEPANELLRRHGARPMERLADLPDAPVRALTTVPCLDDYPRRPATEPYYGLLHHPGGGAWPGWPEGDGARVLGYLRLAYPSGRRILEALERLPVRALVCVPDADEQLLADFAHSGRLRVTRQPLDVAHGARECDLGVGYGSIGFVTDLLRHGKPLLAAPPFVQHAMVAMRVSRAGAGVFAAPGWEAETYEGWLRRLLEDPGYARAARRMAEEIAAYPSGREVACRIVEECEERL